MTSPLNTPASMRPVRVAGSIVTCFIPDKSMTRPLEVPQPM